ncbi:unnamed protein product [Boreogadus saida]
MSYSLHENVGPRIVAMASVDVEEMSPFPLEPDGSPWRDQRDQRDQRERQERRGRRGPSGCCDGFQRSVSQWMLPPAHRETYLQRTNCCPPPIFIILISVAELAVFIYYAVWKPQKQWVTLDEGIWESPLTYRADRRWEAWRFGSYMFVHAGVEHILGNLVMQLLLGIPLELVHKGFEVGMVYLAGVLAGELSSTPPLQCPTVSFVAHIAGAVAGMSVGYVFFSAFNQKLLRDPRFWLCIAGYLVFVMAAVLFNVFLSPAP